MKRAVLFLAAVLILGGIFALDRPIYIKQPAEVSQTLPSVGEKTGKNLNLVLVGDIMFGRGVDAMAEKRGGGDPRYPFLKIAEELRAADLAFANLEGPMSARGVNQGSMYSFRFEPKYVEGLKFAGLDVLSVANNHIFDWGRDALTDTRKILEENGIAAVGSGKNYEEANRPFIAWMGSTTLGFLAYTNLLPENFSATDTRAGLSDISRAEEHIRSLRSKVDVLVVSVHWGEEYKVKPNAAQKKLGRSFIDAGADLVVGHHPHVVQEIEEYPPRGEADTSGSKKYIIYSLGNFVFDQDFSAETMRGLMVIAKIENNKIVELETKEVRISKTYQPEI